MISGLRAYMRKTYGATAGTAITMLLFIALLSAALAACGTNSTTTGSGSTSSAPTQAPSTQVQKCGNVHMMGKTSIAPSNSKEAEHCFWQAYQHCQNATLTFTSAGVDAGVIRTFTIKNNGGQCSISEAVQHYIAPRPASKATTYTCSGVTQKADGLHFSSCGNEKEIVVPAMLGA